MPNQFVQTYPTGEEVLRKIEELKREGYSENDMYVMSRKNDELSLVRGQTNVDYHVPEDKWIDRFASFLTGNEEVHQAFMSMGINEHESEELYQNVQDGQLLLYVDRRYAERFEHDKDEESFELGEKEKTTVQNKKLNTEDTRELQQENEEKTEEIDSRHYKR
ncbi:general stress protein [Planococcus salinus]|uniref:General stress protein 17M-like domain-containing protein n=1 Tax=Planococcus salinus TaxID=1848460 RepID=A0A3M8P8X0_9BACL|nr:general stress protein [Planococcus salinus]RNF40156.1 hypothetical protein EEX84_05825 [Planococcus salinus]